MKISKRQLKRIIREEYSRLKRRGLIKESINDEQRVMDMIMFLDDLMANSEEYDYDEYGVENKLRSAFPDATEDEIQEAMERF